MVMKRQNIFVYTWLFFGLWLAGCSAEEDAVNPSEQSVKEVSTTVEVEKPMVMVDDDYLGERASYFYDWNGSYYSEFDPYSLYESINNDGSVLHWSFDSSGTFFYHQGDISSADTIIYDDRISGSVDLAVINDKVYVSSVSSIFEEDRKLVIYEQVGDAFEVKDSVSVDVVGSVELFSMEGNEGEIVINIVQNALKKYGKSNLRHVYRYKNEALSLLKSYPSATDGPIIKIFPFQGAYLEYYEGRRTLSKLDENGNATVILDGSDLDTPEERIGWKNLHFSDNMIIIDTDKLVSTVSPEGLAVLYDGQQLYRVTIPAVLSSGGFPQHTLFVDGSKFIHYNLASKQLDVYYKGIATILYVTYPRTYHYQLVLDSE